MFSMSVPDFLMTMAAGLLVLGIICLLTGVFMLVFKAAGKDVRTIAQSTTQLAQKGLADDVAGLVGNASALLNALDQMVRTTAGIGIFLVFTSFLLMGAAYLLIAQIR